MDVFRLRKHVLATQSIAEFEKDWRKAEKFIRRGDGDGGKKVMLHALRLLVLSLQIMEMGMVMDYTVTQPLHEEMQCWYEKRWHVLDARFGERAREMVRRLKEMADE